MMKTRFGPMPLIGAAIVATMLGSPASAQARADAPPKPAEIARMQAREADDIALLVALRPEQRPALTAFLQSMMPPPPPLPSSPPLRDGRGPEPDGTDARGKRPPETAPSLDGFARHLDRMTKDAARRAADDGRRLTAARTFYDGLDPAQRRAFEAVMRLRHGPGGPGGRGMRGPGEPGMRGPMGGPGRPAMHGGDGPLPPENDTPETGAAPPQ